MDKVFLIAEAGVNHNGDVALARKMIDVAADSGVDCVKFQIFRSEDLSTGGAEKAAYQKETTGADESQLAMLKRLELPAAAHGELKAHCERRGVVYLASPFDPASIRVLADLNCDLLKIPSGQITDLPYLRQIGALGKSVIMATGMSNLDEIGAALEILGASGTPRERITVLQCTTEYPACFEDVNLTAMLTIRDAFHVAVGLSDHSEGVTAALAAAALGAAVIEKHFTLDRSLPGPDHRASLEPAGLRCLVEGVRTVEKIMGDGRKIPAPAELPTMRLVRKSIVAARDIRRGETLTVDNLVTKRPGSGVSAMHWDAVLGTGAVRDFRKDELIER